MKRLTLIVLMATALANGQQKAPKPLGGGHSIKSLAIEVGPNSPMPTLLFASPNSKPKRLVEGLNPVLSPDGNKIAYCRREAFGFGQIEVINTDGSGHVQLTKLKGGACPTDWSPDGENIAFTAEGTQPASIFVMSKNGDNLKQIGEGYGARWSLDGRQLVFCRAAERRGASDSIWIVNADGTGPTKVIEDNSPVLEPAWFPDGKSIVFSSERESKHRSALFRVNLDGSGLEAIAADKRLELYFPIVSPDGTQILADAYPGGTGEATVLMFDLATHHASLVTHGKHPSVLWGKP